MSEHVYACECGRPLQQECVEGIIPGGRMSFGSSVIVCYRCECSPGTERVRRYYAMPDAVARLTSGEGLPYRNPHALVPVPGNHPDMREWRDFIDKHGHDVEEFIVHLHRQ